MWPRSVFGYPLPCRGTGRVPLQAVHPLQAMWVNAHTSRRSAWARGAHVSRLPLTLRLGLCRTLLLELQLAAKDYKAGIQIYNLVSHSGAMAPETKLHTLPQSRAVNPSAMHLHFTRLLPPVDVCTHAQTLQTVQTKQRHSGAVALYFTGVVAQWHASCAPLWNCVTVSCHCNCVRRWRKT